MGLPLLVYVRYNQSQSDIVISTDEGVKGGVVEPKCGCDESALVTIITTILRYFTPRQLAPASWRL
jgi:hypothetical protein